MNAAEHADLVADQAEAWPQYGRCACGLILWECDCAQGDPAVHVICSGCGNDNGECDCPGGERAPLFDLPDIPVPPWPVVDPITLVGRVDVRPADLRAYAPADLRAYAPYEIRISVDTTGIQAALRRIILALEPAGPRRDVARGRVLGYTGPLTPRQLAHWHRRAGGR